MCLSVLRLGFVEWEDWNCGVTVNKGEDARFMVKVHGRKNGEFLKRYFE